LPCASSYVGVDRILQKVEDASYSDASSTFWVRIEVIEA
jgi:hypothetical protein